VPVVDPVQRVLGPEEHRPLQVPVSPDPEVGPAHPDRAQTVLVDPERPALCARCGSGPVLDARCAPLSVWDGLFPAHLRPARAGQDGKRRVDSLLPERPTDAFRRRKTQGRDAVPFR